MRKYLLHIQRNIQKAYTYRDQTRGIQKGNFAQRTSESDVVESYGASGMPALMLMFPASDTATPIDEVKDEANNGSSDVYAPDGKIVKKNATQEQLAQLDNGLYIFQRKKYLVK